MKYFCWLLCAALSGAITPVASQEAFPNRPIRIVVGTTAGGANDVAARVLAEVIQGELGQPVIVENRVGASGTIGAGYVAKAPPDGHTLFLGTGSTHVVAPAMMKNAGYDPVKDFTPIVFVGRASVVLMAGPSLPVNSLAELVEAARKRPGAISYATSGPAAIYELSALSLESLTGTQFNHVPYKGYPQIIADLVGGHVDIAVGAADASTLNPKIRTLAVLGNKRLASRPDVPTTAELGFREFDVPVWSALYAPANMPRPLVNKLVSVFRAALARRDVKEKIAGTGVEVDSADDAALARLMQSELVTIRALMRKANVEPQ